MKLNMKILEDPSKNKLKNKSHACHVCEMNVIHETFLHIEKNRLHTYYFDINLFIECIHSIY